MPDFTTLTHFSWCRIKTRLHTQSWFFSHDKDRGGGRWSTDEVRCEHSLRTTTTTALKKIGSTSAAFFKMGVSTWKTFSCVKKISSAIFILRRRKGGKINIWILIQQTHQKLLAYCLFHAPKSKENGFLWKKAVAAAKVEVEAEEEEDSFMRNDFMSISWQMFISLAEWCQGTRWTLLHPSPAAIRKVSHCFLKVTHQLLVL